MLLKQKHVALTHQALQPFLPQISRAGAQSLFAQGRTQLRFDLRARGAVEGGQAQRETSGLGPLYHHARFTVRFAARMPDTDAPQG